MSLSRAEQREIQRADVERRRQREISEYLALHAPDSRNAAWSDHPFADVNAELTEGVGRVVAPRSYVGHRRITNARAIPTRTVGIAPGTEDSNDGTPTVRVIHADGSSEIRTAASFRAQRAKAERTSHESVPETDPRMSDVQRFADLLGSQADVD